MQQSRSSSWVKENASVAAPCPHIGALWESTLLRAQWRRQQQTNTHPPTHTHTHTHINMSGRPKRHAFLRTLKWARIESLHRILCIVLLTVAKVMKRTDLEPCQATAEARQPRARLWMPGCSPGVGGLWLWSHTSTIQPWALSMDP